MRCLFSQRRGRKSPARRFAPTCSGSIARKRVEKLGLYPGDLRTLLVMGGSQGASGINQAMIKSLPSLQRYPAPGDSPFRRARRTSRWRTITSAKTSRHTSRPFIIAMEEVYSAADFAIARAGAASLAELAAFSLPAILIPYPYAADDHQTRNAEIFVRADAAFILREAELAGDLLAQKIRDLIERSRPSCARMSERPSALAPKKRGRIGRRNDGKIQSAK